MNEHSTIGLVGCGDWGRHILRDLRSLGCSVPVVARSEASRRRAEQGGADAIVPRIDLLPHVDGVVVATPTPTHGGVLESVLPIGVPVFVEKPLTEDPASARRLADAAPDRLFVMHKWRYHPGVELLAGIARSGELGAVRGVETIRLGRVHAGGDSDAIWRMAPHDVSIALHLLGHLPPVRAAVSETADGEPLGLFGLLGGDPWAALTVSSRTTHRRREVVLRCEEGVASLRDPYDAQVYVARGPMETEPEALPISTELPLLRELRAFAEHLRGGPPPLSSAAEGAAMVETLADLRSAAGLDAGVRR